MAGPAYAVSITDSIGNSYSKISSLQMHAHNAVPKGLSGAWCEAFWCFSSGGAVSSLTVTWNQSCRNRFIWAYRFRNHDGSPFQIRTYGNYDLDVYNSDQVPDPTPSPLPTWTFSRANGRVILGCMAAKDPSYATETNTFVPAENFRYGGSGQDGDMRTAITAATTNLLGTGETGSIDPTFLNLDGGGGSPQIHIWKTVYAFGMNPTVGNSISNTTVNDNFDKAGSSGLGTTCNLPTGASTLLNEVAAGDGLLVFASAPPYLIDGGIELSTISYRAHSINELD